MARNDDKQPNLSTRMDTFEERLNTLESTIKVMVQELNNINRIQINHPKSSISIPSTHSQIDDFSDKEFNYPAY